jgi:catechol 2,3-dioxygenase-like lactoylglutathione lyase family enzyme
MKALHHVGITVSDLERGIDFYHGVLGLGFVNEPSPLFDDAELGQHVAFLVDDIEAKKAELESRGVEFYSDVNVVDDGVLAGWRWVYFSDPDGNALELVEIAYTPLEERATGIGAYVEQRAARTASSQRSVA